MRVVGGQAGDGCFAAGAAGDGARLDAARLDAARLDAARLLGAARLLDAARLDGRVGGSSGSIGGIHTSGVSESSSSCSAGCGGGVGASCGDRSSHSPVAVFHCLGGTPELGR